MESAFELRPIDTQPFSQAMSLPSGASTHSNAKPQRLQRLHVDPPMNTDRTPGPGRRCRVPHAAMSKSDAAAPFARAGRCISLAKAQSTVSGPNRTTRCGVRLPGSVLKKPHSARYGVFALPRTRPRLFQHAAVSVSINLSTTKNLGCGVTPSPPRSWTTHSARQRTSTGSPPAANRSRRRPSNRPSCTDRR